MCGIAGFAGEFVPGLAARMNAVQGHRGPDDSGIYEDTEADIAIGHVRLAILDLSQAAAQPMISAELVLAFNGEIYNFRDLKEELRGLGYRFASSGDTEVLLHGMRHFGTDFLGKLNGMFAFALWNSNTRELLLARDHFGVKPLYYAQPTRGTLLFASEIKAMCAHPQLKREPDFSAIHQHLAYCHASADRTALSAVKRVPPGSYLHWKARERELILHRYWTPQLNSMKEPVHDNASAQIRTLVRRATERQLVSDVPVGCLLSGGLDSSFIVSEASRGCGRDLDCYTITYPESDNVLDQYQQDAKYARGLGKALGLRLTEIELSPAVTDLWPRLIHHLDEPIADPAAISCYLLCEAARKNGVPVLLTGQGADELFMGYPRYPAMRATNWLSHIPAALRHTIARAAKHIPAGREGSLGAEIRRVRRVMVELGRNANERFLSYCANAPQEEIWSILTPEFRSQLGPDRSYMNDCLAQMAAAKTDGLHGMRDRDISIYLPNHNLLYTDKMAMAVGVEARVPFLDMELARVALQLPLGFLLKRFQTKAVLREAARGSVPAEIINRRKAGFGAPYRKWLRYDLAPLWEDLTSNMSTLQRGWFDPAGLARIRQQSQEGRADLYMLQWAVLTVEIWARQFLDRNPAL
jgi:asparagine synthase (glutamine-hydrolysing)